MEFLKKKISSSPNYMKIIDVLGKHGSLRYSEIKEKSGINKNSFNRILKKLVKEYRLIEKREKDRIIIYNLTKLGSKIYEQSEKYEKIKKEKEYQKIIRKYEYFDKFYCSVDSKIKKRSKKAFLILLIDNNYPIYLGRKISWYIANSHPKLFYKNKEHQDFSRFLKYHFKAANLYDDLLLSIQDEFQKAINYIIKSEITPKLIETTIKSRSNEDNEKRFYLYDSDQIIIEINTEVEISFSKSTDEKWIFENCKMNLNNKANKYIQFLNECGILDKLIWTRIYEYKKFYPDQYSNFDNYKRNLNKLIPLIISKSNSIAKYTVLEAPKLDYPFDLFFSYISKIGYIIDIKQQFSNGKKLINEALKIFPQIYILYVIKAIILYRAFNFNLALKALEKAIILLRKNYQNNMEIYKKIEMIILKVRLYILIPLSKWDEAFEIYEELLDSPDFNIKNSIKLFKFDSINQTIIFPEIIDISDKEDINFQIKLTSFFLDKPEQCEDIHIKKKELQILDYIMDVYEIFSISSQND